jgi:hypothetical protein
MLAPVSIDSAGSAYSNLDWLINWISKYAVDSIRLISSGFNERKLTKAYNIFFINLMMVFQLKSPEPPAVVAILSTFSINLISRKYRGIYPVLSDILLSRLYSGIATTISSQSSKNYPTPGTIIALLDIFRIV